MLIRYGISFKGWGFTTLPCSWVWFKKLAQVLHMQALLTGLIFPQLCWSDTNQERNGMLENIEGNRRKVFFLLHLAGLVPHVHSVQLKGEKWSCGERYLGYYFLCGNLIYKGCFAFIKIQETQSPDETKTFLQEKYSSSPFTCLGFWDSLMSDPGFPLPSTLSSQATQIQG